MAADPEPCDRITLPNTERPIAAGDPHRPNSIGWMDALEAQRGVKGILHPQAVGLPGGTLDLFGEISVFRPEGREGGGVHNSSRFRGFACPAAISCRARRAAAASWGWVCAND